MNILLIGNGGREHALAWKLTQSVHCSRLYTLPGNAGTAQLGTNIEQSPTDFQAIKSAVLENDIQMVVVGPEAPLVEGIYDFFRQDPELQGVQLFGPSKESAQLEGSKAFAKAFMEEFGIPTAAYRSFTLEEMDAGMAFIRLQTPPIVLKADGLAAGKGVLICQDHATAEQELRAMLQGKFGQASTRVVIEQFLKGLEFSVFVITDGQSYQLLPVAKDYKRIGEADTGLNTGGMGAVSPVPFVDSVMMHKVEERIIRPTIQGLQKRGMDYQGFIFFGLIEVQGEPYVIEYNCRMGDPETEVVIPRLQSDLVALIQAAGNGTLPEQQVLIDPRAACTVVMVSGGYPQNYEKGKVINGLAKVPNDSLVFHAGTRGDGQVVKTDGGRVLAVTSYGDHFQQALKKSYSAIQSINFEAHYYRKDIGFDLEL